MNGGAANPLRERLLEHLIVPFRLVVGVEEQMGVSVDEAGQKRHAGQVDDLRSLRRINLVHGPGC